MDKPVIEHDNLYNDLLQINREFALETQHKGYPYCGGVLHRANYPRVPRDLSKLFDISLVVRFHFCCSGDECRRRTAPPFIEIKRQINEEAEQDHQIGIITRDMNLLLNAVGWYLTKYDSFNAMQSSFPYSYCKHSY